MNETSFRCGSPLYFNIFSEKIQPGPSISLQCVSIGRPNPKLSWVLNGKLLISNRKFVIREEKSNNGTIASKVIVKNIRTRDGGAYSCIAENKVEKMVFTERITVYGLPYVHQMDNVTVAAGQNVTLNCYVSGHPIKFIKWERGKSCDSLMFCIFIA